MTKLLALLSLLVAVWVSPAHAQNYLLNGTPINDCSGTLYDSGGGSGKYANNEHTVTTICSDGMGGTHIQLNFAGVDLVPGDELCFYDGINTSATLLSCASDYDAGEPFIVQATAVNPSGCLTVEFTSDASGTATGFAALLTCVASCQTVLSDLVSTVPAANPADTGWIDVCPGKRIFFNGTGIYPQNNFAYNQSDFTTKFEWNFGDGDISYGPNTSHRFDKPGGYYVQLLLTDEKGCRSTNLINQRVRVAPRPVFDLSSALNQSICAGDTVQLSAGLNGSGGKTVSVTPKTSSFAVEGVRSDSLQLPDGTGIPYKTSIYFTEFSPGQVLVNPNDLESICVNIEHSWMRDLQISLSCPNGQSIILHNFAGQMGSEVHLGIPVDNDGFSPTPGTGYDYCWTPNATNPTWIQYANTNLGGMGTLPSGNYTPFQPITNLVGCPLNGEWTITATDNWASDNGYLFSWGVKFKDYLYPNIETFTPQFVSWKWGAHPSIFFATNDSIAAAPQNAGTAGYVFTVNDAFGCSWDTLVNVAVLPYLHPNCYKCTQTYNALIDTSLCAGNPVTFNAAPVQPLTQEVKFEAFPNYLIGNGNHPHSNPYLSPISISSLGYSQLTNPLTQIAEVCMDLETDYDSDITAYLRAPDGKQIELTSGNGGSGDNFKITCFKPTASTSIIGSTAPFNGSYKPEGNWATLTNAQVNGDWKLVLSDGFGVAQLGKLKWWSLGFNFTDNITYNWTNPASLSCNNCPNPVTTPSATSTYIVNAVNSFNCTHQDTVDVTIINFFPAPGNLQLASSNTNSMTWSWSAVQGAAGYEVSVNGGAWTSVANNLSYTIGSLNDGDLVNISVRALGGSATCPPQVSSASKTFVICTLTANVDSTTPATCNGTATGSAVISVLNANPPIDFIVDGTGPILPTGNLSNIFSAGSHFVIVRDADGCKDTVSFNITEPPAIMVTASAVNAVCHGIDNGKVTSSASGGTGTLTAKWQGCAGGPMYNGFNVNGLFAGCYNLTVTDASGCTATTSVTIGEPAAFIFTSTQDSVSCNGGSDGSATAFVTGGTPPYTYLWSNGNTTQTATGLPAGFHQVAVTDSLNCQVFSFAKVDQPSILKIDSITIRSVTCFGDNNGTANVFAGGGTKPYTYKWSDASGQTTQKALNLPAGLYSVTVTDKNGCSIVNNTIVPSPTDLTVTTSGIEAEKCAGNCDGKTTIQLSGGTPQYSVQWSNPSVPAGTTNATNLCPGLYTITVQDSKGCSKTVQADIQAAVPITIQFTEMPPVCAGQPNGSVSAVAGGGAGNYNYLWSNNVVTPDLQNIDCGNYTLTVTDGLGCFKVDTANLICPQVIQISSIVPQATSCFNGSNGKITVQALGGSGTLIYKWSDPAGQTTATASNLNAGTYTVTITDANGCSTSSTAQVTEPPVLSATFVKNDVTCFGGNTGSITVTANGGTPGYNFAWTGALTGATISSLTAGNYTVTISDNSGCTLAVNAPALGQPATALTLVVAQSKKACFGANNGEALATGSGSNGGPFAYVWEDSQTGALAKNLSVGTHTVTATDALGCTATNTIQIEQLDSIKINAAFLPPSCFGVSNGVAAVNMVKGGIGNGDTLNYDYKWSVPNAANSTVITGLSGGQNYFLTVTDQQGCAGVFSFTLTQPAAIELQTGFKNVSCFGLSDGSASINSVKNAQGSVKYLWSTNDQTGSLTNLAAGMYNVTVTDSLGCTSSTGIEVNEPQPLGVTFEIKQLLCTNAKNAEIKAKVTGGTPQYSLLWSNGATTTNITNLSPDLYKINIKDQNGCILNDSVYITRPDSIVINSERIDPLCAGQQTGRLSLSVSGGEAPYRYSINGSAFMGTSTFIGLKAGPYALQIVDANGCTASGADTLVTPPQISVSVDADTSIILGQSLLLSATVSDAFGLVDYVWESSLVDSFSCVDTPICSQILVMPTLSNSYTVTVNDEHGCPAEATVRVQVEKPRGVFVPTGFSPDANGANDILMVHGKSEQIRKVLIFRVFDRWGELMYEDQNFAVNDATRGWDGRFRGKDCDPAVFVWYVEVEYLDGYRETVTGNTTLVR
jgi:gliding motility-associated-like protein